MEKFILHDVDQTIIAAVFKRSQDLILKALPGTDIQHIGATSVKGLLTKGDLDILVRVTEESFSDALEVLKKLYTVNQPENWTDTFASFNSDEEAMPLGVQLSVIDSQDDRVFLELREKLNSDQLLVKKFNQLKMDCAGQSMDEYRTAKSKFIKEFLEQ